MKKKYFLRGLGAGILITALILSIGYRKQDSGETVVQRAKELGMVFPEKTPQATATASGSAVAVTATPADTPEALPKQSQSPTADTTKKPDAKPTATSTKEDKPKPTAGNSTSKRKFTVRDGLLSSSVAREMKEAGIIKDADAFDKYIEKSGMARKIRTGTYKIPVGASYSQIAKIITWSE